MLSLFPDLLNYSQIAPFVLRVSLAVALFRYGAHYLKKTNYKKVIGLIYVIVPFFLLIGLFTQGVVLLITQILLIDIIRKKEEPCLDKKILRLIMFAVALSLLFLGSGIFSADLPL